MKLTLRGSYTVDQLKTQLTVFLDTLATDGVDVITSAYLYFTPHSDGRPVAFLAAHGGPLNELEVAPPPKFVMRAGFAPAFEGMAEADQREYIRHLMAEVARIDAVLVRRASEDADKDEKQANGPDDMARRWRGYAARS